MWLGSLALNLDCPQCAAKRSHHPTVMDGGIPHSTAYSIRENPPTHKDAPMPASEEVRTEVAARRAKAVQMRITGASLEEIADTLNYGGSTVESRRASVCKDLKRAFEAAKDEEKTSVEEWINLELARLDRIQQGLWPAAIDGDTKASAAVLQVMDRRSRYLGLDAAVKVNTELDVQVPAEAMSMIERARQQTEAAAARLREQADSA